MTDFVYILEQHSPDDRPIYYVGITGDIMQRIAQHMTGRGASWTKRFPFKRLHHAESFSNKTKDMMEEIENEFTLMMMAKKGIENVRGGKWANVRLTSDEIIEIMRSIKPIQGICPTCGQGHTICDFKNIAYTRQPTEAAQPTLPAHPRKAKKLPAEATVKRVFHCSRCGFPDHKANHCRARVNVNGDQLGLNPAIECVRCGRGNHTIAVCNARHHKDGTELPPKTTATYSCQQKDRDDD